MNGLGPGLAGQTGRLCFIRHGAPALPCIALDPLPIQQEKYHQKKLHALPTPCDNRATAGSLIVQIVKLPLRIKSIKLIALFGFASAKSLALRCREWHHGEHLHPTTALP